MPRFLFPRSLAAIAAASILVGLGTTASTAADGYWKYIDTQFKPTEAELQVLGKTPGRVDEKHVSGGFQAEYSGQGSIELFFKNDDVDHKVFQSRLTFTYGASAPMRTLVPGDAIDVQGGISFESNFPGAGSWGTVSVDNGDYFVDLRSGNGQASGKGSFKVPGGGPGATLRYIAGAYIGANGGMSETMTNTYEWVEGQPPVIEPSEEAPGPAEPAAGFGGAWSSNQGDMTLAQSGDAITGTYSQDNGRVTGTVSGRDFTGYWGEDSSSIPCPQERMGTSYWGKLDLTLSPDGQSFSGNWSYCDGAVAGAWTGARQVEEQ